MSAIRRVIVVVGFACGLLSARCGYASDLDRFFQVNRRSDGTFAGRLYAGHISGDTDVETGDVSVLDLSGSGRPALHYDRDTDGDLEAFVRAHADEIRRILFPSDLEGGAQGIPGGPARALDVFDTVMDLGPTAPAGQARGVDLRAETVARNHTTAFLEYERFRVDGVDGNLFKLTPGHDVRFDRLEIGFALPLRFSNLEDSIDSKGYNVGADVHVKYHHYIFPEWQLIPLVGAGANVFLLDSDVAPPIGYIRYGGYVGLSTTAEIAAFVIGAGVLYSISDTTLPGGLVPDNLEPITDALTSRPADQQVTVGGKIAYELPWKQLLVSGGGRHVETVGASAVEDDKQALSQVVASLMYFPSETLGLEIGYKRLFGVSGLRSSSAFVEGALYF